MMTYLSRAAPPVTIEEFRNVRLRSSAEPPGLVLAGFNGNRRVPPPVNEPIKSYAPGSVERAALKERLRSMSNERVDIPNIIGGQEVHTGQLAESVMPHNHRHVLAQW